MFSILSISCFSKLAVFPHTHTKLFPASLSLNFFHPFFFVVLLQRSVCMKKNFFSAILHFDLKGENGEISFIAITTYSTLSFALRMHFETLCTSKQFDACIWRIMQYMYRNFFVWHSFCAMCDSGTMKRKKMYFDQQFVVACKKEIFFILNWVD